MKNNSIYRRYDLEKATHTAHLNGLSTILHMGFNAMTLDELEAFYHSNGGGLASPGDLDPEKLKAWIKGLPEQLIELAYPTLTK